MGNITYQGALDNLFIEDRDPVIEQSNDSEEKTCWGKNSLSEHKPARELTEAENSVLDKVGLPIKS